MDLQRIHGQTHGRRAGSGRNQLRLRQGHGGWSQQQTRLQKVLLWSAGQARGSPLSPGMSQPERWHVAVKDTSRSAEPGKTRAAPLTRDNDELVLLQPLDHHLGANPS
jgi:hypothetical protein